MRLIDADALDKVVYEQTPIKVFGTVRRMAAVREIIANAPTIEAESVKPVKSKLSWEHGYNWDIWDCGHCGSQLRSDANYCDRCGHKVNWEDMGENDT